MTDPIGTAVEVVAGAAATLPAPVKTSLFAALGQLLGGLSAVPAAKLKQFAQGIEDTTNSKSAVAAIVAKGVGEQALQDPVLMEAAAEVYLPTALRKAKNRLNVGGKAAEHITEEPGNPDEAAPPDDDWMNTFMRFAEDASSDKLQDLFGRILAGQIVRPGSFSLATLRTVSELDHTIAEDFSIVWAKSVGTSVDYSPDFQRGAGFVRWQRLIEAGLMSAAHSTQFLPPFTPLVAGNALWTPTQVEGTFLLVQFAANCSARWRLIDFTRVGTQLGSLLPRPDYEANMRQVGAALAQQGVEKVELHSAGKPPELIFEKQSAQP